MINTPFRIVRGLEASILKKPFVDGYVYVATDTKRIYTDVLVNGVESNKLPIGGGNSGIFYAKKTFTDSSDLSFSANDIESNELPNVNDLIINYKSDNVTRDGFYRVIYTNAVTNSVETEYLPVGGKGTGNTGSNSDLLNIIPITPADGLTTLEKGYNIEYSISAKNNAGAPIITPGKATFIINGINVDGGSVVNGGKYNFPIGEYLSTSVNTNTVTLKVSMNVGGVVDEVQTYTWTVKCIDLHLTWNWSYNSSNYISSDKFTLSWSVSGGVNCTTHISVDDGTEIGKDYFIVPMTSAERDGALELSAFDYGAHKFTMWVMTKIGEDDISSNVIEHIITFVGGDEIAPILTVPYFTTKAQQYDTIRIPFLVYKPDTEKVKLSFFVDNNEVLIDEYATTATEPYYWPYTLGQAGEITIKIACTAYPEIFYETVLTVTPLDLGIKEPIDGKAFFLKASDYSGNAQLKQLEKEGKITFSNNFDWVNGGLQTEIDENGSINNYICVRQGTRMTINYNLFGSNQVGRQGKMFKFCFKAVNCYDYEAPVLECYEDNTQLGLKFTAQQALFSSSASANFATQYCEGSYIELETEIWPDAQDNGDLLGDRFLMFWVDGVPAGVQVFDTGTSFVQNNPKYITIGSDLCDVYIYIIKIYDRKLSTLEHLNNFILDAPNINEKLARFNRNDILGANNEISYEKLVANNPGCHAYLYKLTENGMTTGKEDEKDCDYTEYYLDSKKPVLTAQGAKVMVQGTSSAAYGVAAFNVRTDFGDTVMYDGDGNQLDGRKVSDTSIPVDFTCTKVNVASCENANNALNAEWYNRYQPYYDGHRRKSTATKQYRDCMEFDFGVMFIEDHNKNKNYKNADGKPDKTLYTSTNVFAYNVDGKEDNKYINAPYYKQYAVANMGNDKKNKSVFHDTKNPYACCVEVLDNQNAEHWMTKTVNINDFVWSDEDDGFYEFRYSVEKRKADDLKGITPEIQAQAFIDFVNWMASCDPRPYDPDKHPHGYTGELLDVPVEYTSKKVFAGFIPEGWDKTTSSGVSLAGFETSKYIGKYTHDTKEYRIAKMLYECEDHLVMDSVVYHYLFIQRHTMVDNVAKNTFWSTEDLVHWDLTKNYDNDTSDGNDNSGYLRYGYGKEIMDKRSDGADIFNASDSVWLNFIYNIPDVQEYLYKKLADKKINGASVWDSRAYLALFKEKQSLIPERCWIEDYFRKYIRPRRLGLDGDNSFIQRLEGGLKTHQRQQYENYQGYYIDSKYCTGSAFSDTGSLDMRLNQGNAQYRLTADTTIQNGKNYFELKTFTDSQGLSWTDYVRINITNDMLDINPNDKGYYEISAGGWQKTEKFPTSYYIDLYPSAHIGGQVWRSPTRLSRGQTIDIPVGQMLDAPTDATCYIYAANMIQTIKGIADTYPNYIGISAAAKLREFEAGSDKEGYFNDKLNNAVLNTNTQLEKAQLQQVGSKQLSGLDLSNLAMLKELKINKNSTFPSLKLAKGGIINTLYLNPLTSLTVKDLQLLEDFQYDADIFDTLKEICIMNCPALNEFSYEIAKRNKFARYCFNDIVWTVPIQEADGTNNIDIDTGKITILENLLDNKGYVEVANPSLALTGKLIIDINVDLQDKLSEYDIYKTYKTIFPNLNIEYAGEYLSTGLQPAHTITFYNAHGGDVLYTVKTDGKQTLSHLTSSYGPVGEAIGTPMKNSDAEYDYTWDEKWQDEQGNIITNEQMLESTPTQDKQFYALFKETQHPYTITVKDYDGAILDINFGNKIYYGDDITNLMPIYRYRHHPVDGMRYEFQGWIDAKDYLSNTSNPTIIKNFVVTGNVTYYAYYIEQNCLETASKPDYFTFDSTGSVIKLNDKYRYLIQEPITLPLKNGSTDITTIDAFGIPEPDATDDTKIIQIPKIYFLNNGAGGQYQHIAANAFNARPQQGNFNSKRILLQHIHLPATITTIGNNAFYGCTSLETINLPNGLDEEYGITSIGTYAFNTTGKLQLKETSTYKPLNKVKEIGVSAFYQAGPNVYLNTLPPALDTINAFAFAYCENVAFEDFTNVQIMSTNSPLSGCGKHTKIDVLLPVSLDGFADNCFSEYAVGNINSITIAGVTADENIITRLGLSYSNPTTIEQVIE